MEQKNTLNLPLAIVLAGIIIAGGVFFGLKSSNEENKVTRSSGSAGLIVDFRMPEENDYLLGSPSADIILIEYSDLECPACKFFHNSMAFAMDEFARDGKLSWVYRQFPLSSLHKKAVKESEAILCAGKLGGTKSYWDLTNKIFEITPSNDGLDLTKLPDYAVEIGLNKSSFSACLDGGEMLPRIEREYNEALTAGARGTPFSILVLKNQLSNQQIQDFENYVKMNGLIGGDGLPFVKVANSGKTIILEAALYSDDMVNLISKIVNL